MSNELINWYKTKNTAINMTIFPSSKYDVLVHVIIRNELKRRRECGTYLATARRHRRRLKMQKRDE